LLELFLPARKDNLFSATSGKKEDIQWVLPTSKSSAAIVAKSLLLLLLSKNFSSKKVTPMNQSVVSPAVKPGKQKRAVDEVRCRSILLSVHSAEKRQKYPLSPDRADRCIAAPAIVR
jgi:hypothetical protein